MTSNNKFAAVPAQNQSIKQEFPVPKEIINLVPHVIEDFCRIRRRFQRKLVGSDRIWDGTTKRRKKLAAVKNDPYIRRIEIAVHNEIPTPLQKIALPPERHLSSLQQHSVFTDFCKERKKQINKLLVWKKENSTKKCIADRQSDSPSHSASKVKQISENSNKLEAKSRGQEQFMAKTTLPTKSTDHGKRANGKIKNNTSAPSLKKKERSPRKIFLRDKQIKQKEDSSRELYQRLAKPKAIGSSSSAPSWKLTKGMLNYKPSDRLLEMAQPKAKASSSSSLSDVNKVKKSALHYNASSRIRELAVPPSPPKTSSRDPFQVAGKALFANISDRVTELAFPKKRVDKTVRKHPFTVPRRALYAKASKHTKELAKPKLTRSNHALLNYGYLVYNEM